MQRMNAVAVGVDATDPQKIALTSVVVPRAEDGELLVRIRAIGVGIHDATFLPADRHGPYPIGIEAAGVIEQVGAGVEGFAAGERVAFVSMMQPKGGTWAEYAVVSARSLLLGIPDGLTFEQAAAVPVAGSTALRALAALPDLPAGAGMFVAGASGAVGTFLVQLAKRRGWQVFASASPHNHDYLRRLGADVALDYHADDWRDEILRHHPDGLDLAIAIQPGTTVDSMSVVKDGGAVVTVSADQDRPVRGIALTGLAYRAPILADLQGLCEEIARGDFHLEVQQVLPFDEALAALAKVSTRHARGKTVLALG